MRWQSTKLKAFAVSLLEKSIMIAKLIGGMRIVKSKMVFRNQFKRRYQFYTWQSAKLNELLQWPEHINYFQGVSKHKIKRFFSMVRKQPYVCEAFITGQIKNSTSGVNTKINWFKRKYQYYAWQSAKLNELLEWPEEINYFKGVRKHQIKRLFSIVGK